MTGATLGQCVLSHFTLRRPPRAGFFFCLALRSDTAMDEDLERGIREALAKARAEGKDYLSQSELAVHAVRQMRPDLTTSNALTLVDLVRRP